MFRSANKKLVQVFDSKNVEVNHDPRQDEEDIEIIQPVSSDVLMFNPYSSSPQPNPLQQEPQVQQSPPTPPPPESPPRSRLSSKSSTSGSLRATNRSISPSPSLGLGDPPAVIDLDISAKTEDSSNHGPTSFNFQPISTSNDHELENPRSIIDNAGPPNLENRSNVHKSWGRLGIQTNKPSTRLSGIYTGTLATPGEFTLPTFSLPGEEKTSDDDPIIDNINMSTSNDDYGIQNTGYQPDSDEEEDDDGSETSSSHETNDKHSIDSDSDVQQRETNQPVPGIVTFGKNADKEEGGTINRKQSTKKQNAFWDIFASESADNLSEEDIQCWNKCFVVTRVLFLIFLFFIVLICASVAKVTFLLMTSNIFPQTYNNRTQIKTMFGLLEYDLKSTEVSWIWALNVTIAAPYLFAFFKYFWRLCFRKTGPLQCLPLLLALCTETLHSIGLSVLVFLILPSFEPISAALICFNVGIIPGIFKIFYPARIQKYAEESNLMCARLVNLIALILQIGSVGLWCYYIYINSGDERNWPLMIMIIVAPILISLSWWDNFVHRGKKDSSGFPRLKRFVGQGKTKIGILVSLWKLVMTIIIMPSAIFGTICNNGTMCVQAIFFQSDENPQVNSPIGNSQLVDSDTVEGCKKYVPFLIAILNIVCNGLVFKTAKTACKIVAHKFGYALPVALATPVSIGLLLGFFADTSFRNIHKECYLHFPKWTNDGEIFKVQELFEDTDKLYLITIVAGVLGYLSLHLISNHVWSPGKERLASTDKLFVKPLYCSVLLDQSMFLNRRRCDDEFATNAEKKKKKDIVSAIPEIPDDPDWNPSGDWSVLRKDDTPMIYMCATMWHETENEMTQILKSIFRMDEDQCTRRNMQLFLAIKDPDYYEFEAHIFFDDAFEKHTDGEYEYNVNGYVKMLINVIDLAASSVHNAAMKIPPPTKIPTPYGGRLIWRLPGGNKIVAHLKDKAKIRHRKRWSQVMYMYYFLGHRLTNLKCNRRRKEKIAQNTFLLALDGDVDFQPIAVQLLVDRMKKNPSVGAACGRIHPIGSGPMVWYQKFEYAISHWLQKATENMLGCVLCSPGCFSLFRGSSLMDDNVMHRYTTNPTEALHYVQYDQGEDRWLCTLLLQQGYKVEYVAASDALTYAPEGFYEFYNQRRRWSPSTMANIMDLLMDWKNVTKKNEDISMLYIGYQMFLMVSSILTPGTIFLMVLGAISTGFPTIPAWGAFIINIIPVAIMVILCFTAKSETQLAYSAILSAIYTLLMMIVLIGLLKEAATAKFCSVTTIFLLFVAGVFVVSAILHPQEFFCVMHGVLYFLAIPSMSMLLMIYSLGNLHVVSWGTRETKQPTTPQKQQQTAKGGTGSKVKDWLHSLGGDVPADSSDYDYACGGLFRCICFPQSQRSVEDSKFRIILERLEEMEQKMTEYSRVSTVPNDFSAIVDENMKEDVPMQHFSESAALFEGAGERNNPLYEEPKQQKRDELKNPYWILDEDLKEGPNDFLSENELEFWQPFIDKYLYPLESNKKKEEAIQNELLELRNKVCLGFILINALFVTILFVLTVVDASDKGSLSIPLPCDNPNNSDGKGYIEPISFAFTLIFGILLLLQFVFMILHRIATLIHILASTEVKAKRKFAFGKFWGNDDDGGSIGVDEGLKLVRDMQTAKDDDTQSIMSEASAISDDDNRDATLRQRRGNHLWKKLAKRRIDMQHETLSKTFMKNFGKLQEVVTSDDAASTTAMAEESNLDRSIKDGKMSIAQNRFKHFARPSLHTIVKMAQNENSKAEIQRRGSQMKRNEEKRKMRLKDVANRVILQKQVLGGQGGMRSVARLALMKKREEDESQTVAKTIPEEEDEDLTNTSTKAVVHSSSSDSPTPDETSEDHKDDVSDSSDKEKASSLENVDILF